MDIIDRFPKADVHLHFESLFDIDLLFSIANRNNFIPVLSKHECEIKRQNFCCLADLFALIDVSSSIPQFPQDIYDLFSNYYKKISTKNIVYIEPAINFFIFDYLSPVDIFKQALIASSEAESLYNIKTGFIFQFNRSSDITKQEEVLRSLQNYSQNFSGIGLAGNELQRSSKHFKPLYDLSRNLGFCNNNNTTVHTGEEAPSNYIIESLSYLNVKRIDHGIRAREDPFLMKFLGENNFQMAMCPISNEKLMINQRFCDGKYPYQEFIDSGCMVSINSDDPENLNAYLDDVWKEFYLKSPSSVFAEIAKNAFRMSFMKDSEKTQYINEISLLSNNSN